MAQGPPEPSVYTPFLEPISPYVLPVAPFDDMITAYGISLNYMRSHACPCIYGGEVAGSPDPSCQTCFGRGLYWDDPMGPFVGLITWAHFAPAPDEPGVLVDPRVGAVQHANPTLSIPSYASGAWAEANMYDAFTEIDATQRFNAEIRYPYAMSVPYQQNVTIAPSGAVTIWDPNLKTVVPIQGYTVSGASVVVSGGLTSGAVMIVDFTASPTYVALRRVGAMVHARPFGGLPEPRRFMLQSLDLWTRARFAGDQPTGLPSTPSSF